MPFITSPANTRNFISRNDRKSCKERVRALPYLYPITPALSLYATLPHKSSSKRISETTLFHPAYWPNKWFSSSFFLSFFLSFLLSLPLSLSLSLSLSNRVTHTTHTDRATPRTFLLTSFQLWFSGKLIRHDYQIQLQAHHVSRKTITAKKTPPINTTDPHTNTERSELKCKHTHARRHPHSCTHLLLLTVKKNLTVERQHLALNRYVQIKGPLVKHKSLKLACSCRNDEEDRIMQHVFL